jgi:hypothetical protein
MSPINKSKHAFWVVTKTRELSQLIRNSIGFRVFKAYGVELAIIT